MYEFIIITKETKLNLFTIVFANKEIERLHKKKCNVGIYSNTTHFVIVREIDNSIFWSSEYERINYAKVNAEAIRDIKENYPIYMDYPLPKFIN